MTKKEDGCLVDQQAKKRIIGMEVVAGPPANMRVVEEESKRAFEEQPPEAPESRCTRLEHLGHAGAILVGDRWYISAWSPTWYGS